MATPQGDSTDVSTELKTAFERDPRVDLRRFPIKVLNNGSGLTLEGEVENIAAKRIALRLAQHVTGLDRVIDALRLVPAEPHGDGDVRDAFARGLLQQPELRNCTVRQHNKGQIEAVHEELTYDSPSGEILFGVSNGELTLEGSVISLSHKRMVEAIAWWTPGCRNVVNRIDVVPDEEDNDGELADAVRLVFEMDPLVHADQIGIRAEGGVVTLAGVLRRDEERRIAEMDAWAVWGVAEVRNHIEVQPA
jgi:osmotically-inducible protein OsmY